MVKVVWFRSQQCLVALTMLLLEGSWEMELFRHLFNQVFRSPQFRIYTSAMNAIPFWKYPKFKVDFKIAAANWEINFCFWDNCIWIGFFKLSLLSREYLWPQFNVLTNSPKIFHVTKRHFVRLKCAHSD